MKLVNRLALAFKARSERPVRQNPSVDAYDTTSELKEILGLSQPSVDNDDDDLSIAASARRGSLRSIGSDDGPINSSRHSERKKKTNKKKKKEPVGWKLAVYDKASSEPQTMEEEFKRLQVLQSYFILDSKGEEDFDRITRLASSLFSTPFALVTLVDLGRQWFLSKVGLDATETARDISFCSHAVISKHNVLVVPDSLEDFRFKNNPLVTDPNGPKLRFYAGASLVSPEGYKLGTLCIADVLPRPEGFSDSDQKNLLELSKVVMSALVARRNRLMLAQTQEVIEVAGESFLSAISTLSAATRSIDDYLLTNEDNRDDATLKSTVYELRLQEKLCTTAARTLLEKEEAIVSKTNEPVKDDWTTDALSRYDDLLADEPTTDVLKLFDNLNTVIKSLNSVSVVTMEVAAGVPKRASGDDLLLFRSALNLLMHCINRSEDGIVHLRISCPSQALLLFECEDSGKLVPPDKVASTWKKRGAFLFPIRSVVRSVGGNYGIQHGRLDCMEAPPKAIFWFQTPNKVESAEHEKFSISAKMVHELRQSKTLPGIDRLVVDPFAAILLEGTCINMDHFIQH